MGVRRLVLASVASLGALAGGVVFSAPVALAVAPPVVEEEAVSNVAATSATFQARIDPEGSETTYRFEYGTSEAYGSKIPVPDGIVGSGSVGVAVSAHPQDLTPSTTYHFRVRAIVASRSETVSGGDGTFTTQPAGGKFALPDGRQWELVSPPNKHGALIGPLEGGQSSAGPIQASEDGGGFVYKVNVPTETEPPGYVVESQILSVRGQQGWSSRDIATPHDSVAHLHGSEGDYWFFTPDLSSALAFPRSKDETLLSAQASEPTPYIRREGLCDAPASASECYLPLLTGKEGFADVPPGTKFGPIEHEYKVVYFEGASPDLRHVLLQSLFGVALTSTPIPAGNVFGQDELYEWSAGAPGALQLVSVLPESEGGGPVGKAESVNVGPTQSDSPSGDRHAVSDDGSRVFWTRKLGVLTSLYVRDTVKGETVRLDVQQPGVPAGGEPKAQFQFATGDGSRVFFTDGSRLTARSGAQGYDLYECEIVEEAGKLACRLTDLTPESEGQYVEVQNMVPGVSEDGSHVYFVADAVLGDGAEHGATQGTCSRRESGLLPSETCNLYEYHDGAIAFIARLSAEDQTDWGLCCNNTNVTHVTANVSPDGRYLAFMSYRSLTGYDNRDAFSGKPDAEVYLYDSTTKRLSCASCSPTGARPEGVEFAEFGTAFAKTARHRENLVEVLTSFSNDPKNWVAANLPSADTVAGNSLRQPRVLSDGGRLFFNSSDALVPQDVNGNEDVYEFEPEGTGGCTASSVTFNPGSGGCAGLISAGTSPEESGFLDASMNGSDVFFLTTSKLTAQDYDTGRDVYDAHVCSVSVPCVSPPVSSPPCDSGDSCKGAPSLQPSVFGAPASATFVGAGNVVVSPSKNVRSRSLTRAQKLARALRACAHKPRRRRAACRRRAKRRYAARGARRASGAGGAMRKGQG